MATVTRGAIPIVIVAILSITTKVGVFVVRLLELQGLRITLKVLNRLGSCRVGRPQSRETKCLT